MGGAVGATSPLTASGYTPGGIAATRLERCLHALPRRERCRGVAPSCRGRVAAKRCRSGDIPRQLNRIVLTAHSNPRNVPPQPPARPNSEVEPAELRVTPVHAAINSALHVAVLLVSRRKASSRSHHVESWPGPRRLGQRNRREPHRARQAVGLTSERRQGRLGRRLDSPNDLAAG